MNYSTLASCPRRLTLLAEAGLLGGFLVGFLAVPPDFKAEEEGFLVPEEDL